MSSTRTQMSSRIRSVAMLTAAAAVAQGCATSQSAALPASRQAPEHSIPNKITPIGPSAPLSFGNRLLLNRIVVDGERRADVMLLVDPSTWSDFVANLKEISGDLRFADPRIGYARVTLPIEHLTDLVLAPSIQGYQLAYKSQGNWYRDTAPEETQKMYRKFEVSELPKPSVQAPALPVLKPEQAAADGYTGLEATGLKALREENPTFDGRGVTVAVVETATIQWDHPSFTSALTLEGEPIEKLAGVIYSVDTATPDQARVEMTTITASSTWFSHGLRTYILPEAGTFQFGKHGKWLPDGLVQTTAILWEPASGRFWVDADGDANFQNEKPLAGINRDDARYAEKIGYMGIGRDGDKLPFTVEGSEDGSEAYLYFPPSPHQSMTASVPVGAFAPNSLARGFAPAARLLLVRKGSSALLSDYLEGLIRAAQRDDVDLITTAAGNVYPDMDTSRNFRARLTDEIIRAYQKPIFEGAQNYGPPLQSAGGAGAGFSVGGYVSPATYRAFIGEAGAPEDVVLSGFSSYGPALDGSLQPDFLAPMHLLSVGRSDSQPMPLPLTGPVVATPPGYERSCCTSSSSPAGGGLGAVLLSAAKQNAVAHSPRRVARALHAGARPIPGLSHFAQGAGVINIEEAWKELQRDIDPVEIEFTAPIVDPMSRYSPTPGVGLGLYERGGWSVGDQRRREMVLRRISGPNEPVTYRLGWRSPTQTFSAPQEVTLPLGKPVRIPIDISISAGGAHGALLELHEPDTDAIVAWAPVTVVVPEPADAAGVTKVSGILPVMEHRQHFVTVPTGTDSLRLELEIDEGQSILSILPPNHLWPQYYPHLWESPRYRGPGHYYLQWPNPTPGVWAFAMRNDPFLSMRDETYPKPSTAKYRMQTSAASATLAAKHEPDGSGLSISVEAGNPERLILRSAPARRWSIDKHFPVNGLSEPIDIEVPEGAAVLRLRATADTPVDFYLYECTTGHCFSYDFRVPGADFQEMILRNPKPGLWKAVVNPSARWSELGAYHLETVIADTPTPIHGKLIPIDRQDRSLAKSDEAVTYIEAIDPSAEASEQASPLIGENLYRRLHNRPIPIATAVIEDLPD